MAKSILTILVVLCLASTAAAGPLLSPLYLRNTQESQDTVQGLLDDALRQVPDVDEPENPTPERAEAVVDEAESQVRAVEEEISGLLTCRTVVRIDLTQYAYDILDSRQESRKFWTSESVVDFIPVEVPILETRTETVWEATGLLGFLEPITKTVTEVTGLKIEMQEIERDVDLGVHLGWTEDYLEVTPLTRTYYLDALWGAAWVARGQGEVISLCDPSEIIYTQLPAFDCGDYDGCSPLPISSGWYAHIFCLKVWLADAGDKEGLPFDDAHGIIISGHDAVKLIQDEAEGKGFLEPRHEPEPEGELDFQTQSSAVTHVPTSLVGFFAVAAMVLGGLATVGRMLWNVRKP